VRGSSLVLEKAQDLLGVAFGELVLEERAQTGDITFNASLSRVSKSEFIYDLLSVFPTEWDCELFGLLKLF
jgi:hypothetical protein